MLRLENNRSRYSIIFILLISTLVSLPKTNCLAADKPTPVAIGKEQASAPSNHHSIDATNTATIEKRWGIIIQGVQLTAAGHMLDFRFRVTDPKKAKPLANAKIKPYAAIEGKDVKLEVPNVPRIGALRQTSQQLKKGLRLAILFTNPGRMVAKGQKLTITIGDFSVEHLIVGQLLNPPPKPQRRHKTKTKHA